MAVNATKNSSMTHISQATLDEASQSVKTTITVNGQPVSTLNPLPIDAVLEVSSIQTTTSVEILVDDAPMSAENPLFITGEVQVDSVSLKVSDNIVSSLNPLPVEIMDTEIAIALDKETDSVRVFQGESSPGNVIPWQTESVSVFKQAYVSAKVTVGVSAVETKAGSLRLMNRKLLSIHNQGPNVIYMGPSSVTPVSGRPIFPDQSVDIQVGDLGVFVVASEPGNSVIVQEMA
jgi:hypothetical protein